VYLIKQDIYKNTVVIENTSTGAYAKLYLNEGASLQELVLNNINLIKDIFPLDYKSMYASAILFPFANRVADGTYSFNGENFQLSVNNEEENNALHGLVYNKTFLIKKQYTDEATAQLLLEYQYDKPENGFPFPFCIKLEYIFQRNRLDLKVSVQNKSEVPFPFTVGWHPYFFSEDLNKSFVEFKTRSKLDIGQRNIGIAIKDIELQESLSLKDKRLDDCWQLEDDKVVFKTPQYNLQLSSSEPNSFLQIYMPPKKNTIAIEPTTGVSNSFNNHIGLKVLKPNTEFHVTWVLEVDSN
jgi:aldose 1-epimerase